MAYYGNCLCPISIAVLSRAALHISSYSTPEMGIWTTSCRADSGWCWSPCLPCHTETKCPALPILAMASHLFRAVWQLVREVYQIFNPAHPIPVRVCCSLSRLANLCAKKDAWYEGIHCRYRHMLPECPRQHCLSGSLSAYLSNG